MKSALLNAITLPLRFLFGLQLIVLGVMGVSEAAGAIPELWWYLKSSPGDTFKLVLALFLSGFLPLHLAVFRSLSGIFVFPRQCAPLIVAVHFPLNFVAVVLTFLQDPGTVVWGPNPSVLECLLDVDPPHREMAWASFVSNVILVFLYRDDFRASLQVRSTAETEASP